MSLGPLIATSLVVACSAPSTPRALDSAPHNAIAADAATATTPVGGTRCLPVVARECGCVYACGVGTPREDGGFDVSHDFWGLGTQLRATIAPYCEAGPCVDVFDAAIICDGICVPEQPDPGCHFDEEGTCDGS